MKRVLGVWLLLLMSHAAAAQLNEADTLRLRVRATVSGSWLEGNISRLLVINRVEAAYAQPGWGFATRTDYQYGSIRHRRTENDVDSWNFVYRHPLARAYPYAMLVVETNYRRQVENRLQPGVGVSYSLLHQAPHLLRLSLTGAWEQTRYGGTRFEHRPDTTASVIETWRVIGRIFGQHRLIERRLRVLYEVWYQQALRARANYRYRAEGTLEAPITKHVALRATARYSYENVVLVGIKPNDLFITYGLTISNF
jgi:hypothetical protein